MNAERMGIQMNNEAVVGSLLGTAIGDALGLPYEGISPARAARMLGEPSRYRFFLGKGMVSDDTEHSCMVLQALIDSAGNDDKFAAHFARRLKRWFLTLPAGIGIATAKSSMKLLIGINPNRSGIFSAGNGPAMRSAILGAAIDDLARLRQLVKASTRITHTDPKAEQGAFAVALATRTAKKNQHPSASDYFKQLRELLAEDEAEEFLDCIAEVEKSIATSETTIEFTTRQYGKRGVSGYTLQTVPAVLHAWLRYPTDYRTAITTVIQCGGDADTTAAILGGIIGAGVGRNGIPEELLNGLIEWPRTVRWMENLAEVYASNQSANSPIRSPKLPLWKVLTRNLFFLIIVLFHGFRRLVPPY